MSMASKHLKAGCNDGDPGQPLVGSMYCLFNLRGHTGLFVMKQRHPPFSQASTTPKLILVRYSCLRMFGGHMAAPSQVHGCLKDAILTYGRSHAFPGQFIMRYEST